MLRLAKNINFFFNKRVSDAIRSSHDRGQDPGWSYFKKIYSFIDTHFQIGEVFLEYQKGACEISSGKVRDLQVEKCCSQTERIQRPFPDYQRPGLHYIPVHMTPTDNRTTADDYLPQAQLRKAYHSG